MNTMLQVTLFAGLFVLSQGQYTKYYATVYGDQYGSPYPVNAASNWNLFTFALTGSYTGYTGSFTKKSTWLKAPWTPPPALPIQEWINGGGEYVNIWHYGKVDSQVPFVWDNTWLKERFTGLVAFWLYQVYPIHRYGNTPTTKRTAKVYFGTRDTHTVCQNYDQYSEQCCLDYDAATNVFFNGPDDLACSDVDDFLAKTTGLKDCGFSPSLWDLPDYYGAELSRTFMCKLAAGETEGPLGCASASSLCLTCGDLTVANSQTFDASSLMTGETIDILCNSGYSGSGTAATCTFDATTIVDVMAGETGASWTNIPSCVDINECTDGTHTCDTNAVCTNTDGAFSCACASGYTGDGTTCADLCAAVTCTASTDCKVAGTCNQADGVCSEETNAADDTTCDDGNADTVDDVCTSGSCAGTDKSTAGHIKAFVSISVIAIAVWVF